MMANGVSVAFLMENMLILYAIRNGLSDSLVAVLASFVHLTMPFMLLGKKMVASWGLSRSWAFCWLFRYLSILPIAAAPFLASGGPDWSVPLLILAGAFGFALFRSMGVINNTPLMGEVTTHHNRGRYISGNVLRFNIVYLICMSIVIVVMRFIDKIWVYQCIIVVGCAAGVYGSKLLSTIPESDTPRKSAAKPAGKFLKQIMTTLDLRRLLFAWCAGITSFVIVIPFSVITIKNGYGIPDHSALAFSLMVLVGAIISAFLNGTLADHVGPRPLLIMYGTGFFIVSIFWAFAPNRFMPAFVGVVFLVAGYCKTGLLVGLGHYFLSAVKTEERVFTSLYVRLFAGICAGLMSSVVGGGLLDLLRRIGLEGLDVYRNYFRVVLVVLAPLVYLIYRLKKLEEWPVRDIFDLVFSIRDIRALFVLNRLEQAETPAEDARNVERLADIGSNLGESALLEYVESPHLSIRIRALNALRAIDMSRTAISILLREVQHGEFTTASTAADILGEKRIEKAIPHLRTTLDSPDVELRGRSMVALVRLHDSESYGKIKQRFLESDNPQVVIHGARAVSRIEGNEELDILLQKLESEGMPEAVNNEILIAVSRVCGTDEMFYKLLRSYQTDGSRTYATVVETLAEHSRSKESVKQNHDVSLKYLRRRMTQMAEQQSDPHSMSIHRYLNRVSAEKLSPKTVMCFLIVLSQSREPSAPADYQVE